MTTTTTTTIPNPPKPLTLPWRVVVDTAEQAPFTFTDLRSDSSRGNRPLIIETVRRSIGRHPVGMGDYSLESADGVTSYVGWCNVERKSREDCQTTILGFGDGHRDRFEQELDNLSRLCIGGGCAMIVVECSFEQLISTAPQYGQKTAGQNAKTLLRSVLAYQQDYRVPWLFAGSRRMAEIATFRFLERFWKHHHGKDSAQ
jgi:hypothetical protein